MRESRSWEETICAEVRTTSQFIWRSLWRRARSPQYQDREDENNERLNAKEHKEHMFLQGEDYTYAINTMCESCLQS